MARVIRGFAPEPLNKFVMLDRLLHSALSKGERKIVFEPLAKSYNFERGFFFLYINPSPSLSHTARSFPRLTVSLGEGKLINVTNLFPYFLIPFKQ